MWNYASANTMKHDAV